MSNSIYKSPEGEKSILEFYEKKLNDWPVQKELISITTRFGNTFAIASGDIKDPPLILLHGSSTNSLMWMGDVKEYSKDFRVYALDIIGEPGKSAPSRPEFNTHAYSEWLKDIFDFLKIKKASFVSISLGGWIALNFSIANPEKVEKLVLLCPSGLAKPRLSFLFKVMPLMFLGDFGLRWINKIIYYKEPVNEEVNKFGKLIFSYYNPRFDNLPIFSDGELSKLTMPVYYLGGEKDALLRSQESANRLTKLLPAAKVEVLKETGHVIINVKDKVLKFMK